MLIAPDGRTVFLSAPTGLVVTALGADRITAAAQRRGGVQALRRWTMVEKAR